MRVGKRQRRNLLLVLGLSLAGVLLLALLLPLWFPWLLRPLARAQHLTYLRYERNGYSRFTLYGLDLTNRSVRFHAQRLEALTPTAWLWRLRAQPSHPAEPFLRVTGWQFQSAGSSKTNPSTNSVHTTTHAVADGAQLLRRWLPLAVASQGSLSLGQTRIDLPTLTWSAGQLRAEVHLPNFAQSAQLRADLRRSPFGLELDSPSLLLQSRLRVAVDASTVNLQSTNHWRGNLIQLRAQFGRSGWLPQSAVLQSAQVRLPARWARLPDYQDIQGSVYAQWEAGEFALDLSGGAQPLTAQTNLPPLHLDLHARGDTNAATIQSAVLTSPWLQAELSQEIDLFFAGPLLRQPVALRLNGDLARQPWFPLQGRFNGVADFRPATGRFPLAHFRLDGANVGNARLQARNVHLQGRLDWPWLDLEQARADLSDGPQISLSGRTDLSQKLIANAQLELHGSVARPWLPTGYVCSGLALASSFSGPLTNLSHHGQIEMGKFSSPNLKPLHGQFAWNGRQFQLQRFQTTWTAGAASLQVGGSAALEQHRAAISLESLALRTNQVPILQLTQPSRLEVARGAPGSSWSARLLPFDASGSAGEIHLRGQVDWPAAGTIQARLAHIRSSGLADFLPRQATSAELEIQQLAGRASWTNGPIHLGLELSAAGRFPQLSAPTNQGRQSNSLAAVLSGAILPGTPLALALHLAATGSGLSLSNLLITSQTTTVAKASASLPLALYPGTATDRLRLEQDKPLALDLSVRPQPLLSPELARKSGLSLRQPELRVQLGGTWRDPRGLVEAGVQQIELRKQSRHMPTLENLELKLELDRRLARLTEAQVLLQGQPVTLTAEVPLPDGLPSASNLRSLWPQARGRLRVQEASLTPFADLVPTYLSPQGELDLDVALAPGGRLTGQLLVQGARTRPLPGLGPIRDLSVRLSLGEGELVLQGVNGRVGGSLVTLRGKASLQGTNWLKEKLPPFQLVLRGTNVPLSRQPESIVRSDLNLTLIKTNGAPPLIGGEAHLRQSIFLSDLGSLAGGKVAAPRARPPYFSVDEPALADWRLGVRVTGQKFLKVSSPLFSGQASANFRLQGTLKDPIALGEATIDSGAVRFPFANFQVQRGSVLLTSQDPYRPQLSLNATSRQFGYDLRMNVSGPAEAPVIQFSSTPGLSSEQILLMVTAGQLPKEEMALSREQRAQSFAMFLGRDMLAKLGLGDSAEQRLTISSGEEMTEQGKPTYRVEYRLTPRWSLVGEYDRFNSYNLGLKWRVYSK